MAPGPSRMAWSTSLHFADNRLYRMVAGGDPAVPISPAGPWRYADGVIDTSRRRWIGVRGDHTAGETVNEIVSIDAEHGLTVECMNLAGGHDFYSSPQLSPDGRWLAYLAWDHPNMPWTATGLYVVELDRDGTPRGRPILMAGGDRESIFQPSWTPAGSALLYVSDRSGWWNLYRQKLDGAAQGDRAQGGGVRPAPMAGLWDVHVCIRGIRTGWFVPTSRSGLGCLATIDLASGALTPLDVPWTDFSSVRANGSRVVFRCGSATEAGRIVALDPRLGSVRRFSDQSTAVADDPGVVARYFTRVEAIEFPTQSGQDGVRAVLPASANPDYSAPVDDLPPLVVKCHGGPTSAASSTLDLRIQVLDEPAGLRYSRDVNYGGSTGFGRGYRERLGRQLGDRRCG